MSYPKIPFRKSEITIQPQAKLCMQKLHVTEEDVLTTINEWESGDIQSTTPEEGQILVEYPEKADELPAFYVSDRTFPERGITLCVIYFTSVKKQRDKTKIHASVHWVSTKPLLDFCPDAPTQCPEDSSRHLPAPEAPADWLEPKFTLHLQKYQIKLLLRALPRLKSRSREEQQDIHVLLKMLENVL
jgi:hypothetical protein